MKWNDVSQVKPPRDKLVLCYNPNKSFPMIGGYVLEAGVSPGISIDFANRKNVTHWIELPEEPEEENTNGWYYKGGYTNP